MGKKKGEMNGCCSSVPSAPTKEQLLDMKEYLRRLDPYCDAKRVVSYTAMNPRGHPKCATFKVPPDRMMGIGLNVIHEEIADAIGMPSDSFSLLGSYGTFLPRRGMVCPAEVAPGDLELYEVVPHGMDPIVFEVTEESVEDGCAEAGALFTTTTTERTSGYALPGRGSDGGTGGIGRKRTRGVGLDARNRGGMGNEISVLFFVPINGGGGEPASLSGASFFLFLWGHQPRALVPSPLCAIHTSDP